MDAHTQLLERQTHMLAPILAALHNGPLIRKDEAMWTSDMFLPDYEPPKPDAKMIEAKAELSMRAMKAHFHVPTPEEKDMQRQIAMRMNRARAASESGASAEQIQNIMRGVL